MPALVMICPTLIDKGGHEHDYTKAIAEAAIIDGFSVTTHVPTSAGEVSLPGAIVKDCPRDALPNGALAKSISLTQKLFYYTHLFGRQANTPAIYFIHSISQRQIVLIAIAWLLSPHRHNKLVLFLRHKIGTSLIDELMVRFLRHAVRHDIAFVSDSDLLSDEFTRRIGCHVTTLPIPVAPPSNPRQRDQLICGYFGSRRKNKGFYLLPSLIEKLAALLPDMRFAIQAYGHKDDLIDERVEAALTELKQRTDTRLIESTLDSEDFSQLVFNCDMALIPYDPTIYRYGTSGNFVMSVVARSVVIVTDGSWMAHQARKHNLSRVVLMPWQPSAEETQTALKQVITLLNQPDRATPEEQQWCRTQSKTALWKTLSGNL